MQDIYYPEIDQISLIMKETFYGLTLAPKKYHLCMFLKINGVIKNHFFNHPPFQSSHSQAKSESPYTLSHISQVTPAYSPFTNERSNNNSPDDTQISYELNNPITLQQQLHHRKTLTIHQLASTITSSNSTTPTPSSDYTPSLAQFSTSTQSSSSTNRAHRTFKRKVSNQPFPSKTGIARDYIKHPDHKNTTKFLQLVLPFFPQYTYTHSDPNTEQPNHVDEHVLIPTLH